MKLIKVGMAPQSTATTSDGEEIDYNGLNQMFRFQMQSPSLNQRHSFLSKGAFYKNSVDEEIILWCRWKNSPSSNGALFV